MNLILFTTLVTVKSYAPHLFFTYFDFDDCSGKPVQEKVGIPVTHPQFR
jgi:hypothetical protein